MVGMLTRLWFSLSVLWGSTWLILRCFEIDEFERMAALVFALLPFVLGLLVRGIAKYVITGRL